jgi:hypothetical protein
MIERNPTCPGCASAVPTRAVALAFQLECPTCRTPLRVPFAYQANFMIGSFALGLGGAYYLLGSGEYFVSLAFLLAFVFAAFLGTTIVPLLPPKLDRR